MGDGPGRSGSRSAYGGDDFWLSGMYDRDQPAVEHLNQARPVGGHLSSMFVTLTMDSYGKIHADGAVNDKGQPCSDGSPVDPEHYNYPRAARDIVFFSKLVDRWIQNLRRCVGYDVQYFATVEPQRRGAPHLHILIRGVVSREILKQVTAATYHQVWWPRFDAEDQVYGGTHIPVWDHKKATFVDPETGKALTYWDDALDILDAVDDLEPAHTVRFGPQMDRKQITGIAGGGDGKGRSDHRLRHQVPGEVDRGNR
ncbi:replication initiator [Nocardia sp. NPDC050175]|uniref:replication initiator n=1 Tax=Nocardia sp. NPDC050175 TaxID=3364317 RepID=UPI0037AE1E57